MFEGKLFMSGRSQAVRLPKECRFEGNSVIVKPQDGFVALYPKHSGWDIMERSLGKFTPDFMRERKQPRLGKRRVRL